MTRQFNIDSRLLCYQHLLGEHSEMHEGVGLITSDHAKENPGTVQAQLEGQARAGNIDTSWFKPRHDALAEELERRGGNHNSPLEYDDDLALGEDAVEPDETLGTLMKCPGCRPRIVSFYEMVDDDEIPRDERGNRHYITRWVPDGEHPFHNELEAVAREHDDERHVLKLP